MKVRELIARLQLHDPEASVVTGVTCSCYGQGILTDVESSDLDPKYLEDPKLPRGTSKSYVVVSAS